MNSNECIFMIEGHVFAKYANGDKATVKFKVPVVATGRLEAEELAAQKVKEGMGREIISKEVIIVSAQSFLGVHWWDFEFERAKL